jgi:hypothetical protein
MELLTIVTAIILSGAKAFPNMTTEHAFDMADEIITKAKARHAEKEQV